MIDPSHQAIKTLYQDFQKEPERLYRWILSSPARKDISRPYLFPSAMIQYDTGCKLLYTLFQENRIAERRGKTVNALLIDLTQMTSVAFYCELFINRLLVHAFVIQKAGDGKLFMYQTHLPHYTLYDGMSVVSLDHVSDNLRHLSSGIEAYVQAASKALFRFPLKADGPICIHYTKCAYTPFYQITLPQNPQRHPLVSNVFILFYITFAVCLLLIHDRFHTHTHPRAL